ncbi:glycosyltransferase [Granulicella sp. L60]|uniref:glycosyltransferase n=1 Tax=Granulicella sp. L60 TaxID=1641866 RepID=UPI00131C4118|nr:glycosyltransferase [Granulicella sp. L60]
MTEICKPKLVFFRWTNTDTAGYIQLHLDQHVKCLAQFFDVTVISGQCDYSEICDRYHPDLTLFESGVYVSGIARTIRNIFTNSKIPKLGFCHADAMCGSRRAFIADMAQWGVDTFFTLSVSMAEYTPEIADQLYVWPNAVDTELYRDYGERKVIPVLFTGSQAPQYPWRNRICKCVAQYYPSLTCPHFGWGTKATTSRMLFGEQYARLLNASWCAPTCGTVTNDIVRKHFEIPASRSCLITEDTAAVTSAGFVNGKNCIYADVSNVIEALDYLFRHKDEMELIIAAGFDLVQARHTIKQRDQILQWLTLKSCLHPYQHIIQRGPFGPLSIADSRAGTASSHVVSNGIDRVLLQKGDYELGSANYGSAEHFYMQALAYLPLLPEAKLRVAICSLYMGKPGAALKWIDELLKSSERLCSIEPDPWEWIYHLITLLCLGRFNEAAKSSLQYPRLRHPEVDRIRTLIAGVLQRTVCDMSDSTLGRRFSVHQLPEFMVRDWSGSICSMLRACGRVDLVDRVAKCLTSAPEEWQAGKRTARQASCLVPSRALLGVLQTNKLYLALAITNRSNRTINKVSSRLRKHARVLIHKFENRYGYVLPYRISAIRNDELYKCIEDVSREGNVNNILVLGAVAGEGATEACLFGAQQNPTRPDVICINHLQNELTKLKNSARNASFINYYQRIDEATCNSSFGMVVLTGKDHHSMWTPDDEAFDARIIVVNDMNHNNRYQLVRKLSEDRNYSVLAYNPSHRNGYAVFRRM